MIDWLIDTLQSLNFCSSSRAAFQLVMRNLLRVVVLDRLESLKLILISQKFWELKTQRLSELFSQHPSQRDRRAPPSRQAGRRSALWCHLLPRLPWTHPWGRLSFQTLWCDMMQQQVSERMPVVHYLLTPVVAITVGSYLVTTAFFSVYSMAVNTLFICFLEDLERNDGSKERPYYMSRSLRQILGKMEKAALREARRTQDRNAQLWPESRPPAGPGGQRGYRGIYHVGLADSMR